MLGGATLLTLRSDGRLYVGTDEEPLVNLPKDDYRSLASSASPPDLTNFKNSRPVVTKTKAVLLEGDTGVSVPVLAADVEKKSKASQQQGLEKSSVTLVFFLGGVTFTEISALRYLRKHEEGSRDFIVATTKLINGDNILNSIIDTLG